jgi:HAD superfamily phosphoserine phosphatase-like hydrolase
MTHSAFQNICNDFNQKKLKRNIKPSFIKYIKGIPDNSEIVIVTASIKDYIKPWCDEKGFNLISTELEVKNHILTGVFKTPNCKGREKVIRIKEKYDLSKFDKVVAFGDTQDDSFMLKLATQSYYKYFE